MLCVCSTIIGIFVGISIALWGSWDDWVKGQVQPKVDAAVKKAVRECEREHQQRFKEWQQQHYCDKPDGVI
jgi:hypothetical protein